MLFDGAICLEHDEERSPVRHQLFWEISSAVCPSQRGTGAGSVIDLHIIVVTRRVWLQLESDSFNRHML